MIDKKIFYCQFGGGPKSTLNIDCINSWKSKCPNYEIIEINENNFDWTINDYTIEGYEKGNWSAVSNTARLDILSKESGFYLDTDIMLFKSLDEFRKCDKGFITEFTAGQPDVGFLGCGKDFYPEVYKLAKEQLVCGTTMHKIWLRNLYKMYNIHGESKEIYADGFTVYNDEWIPAYRNRFKNENTIGIHYYENSQKDHPLEVTDDFYALQKVVVYANDKKIYEDFDPVVKITLNNPRMRWRDSSVIFRLNYFFNPSVVKIEAENFTAERIGCNELGNMTVTASGLRVYQLG